MSTSSTIWRPNVPETVAARLPRLSGAGAAAAASERPPSLEEAKSAPMSDGMVLLFFSMKFPTV